MGSWAKEPSVRTPMPVPVGVSRQPHMPDPPTIAVSPVGLPGDGPACIIGCITGLPEDGGNVTAVRAYAATGWVLAVIPRGMNVHRHRRHPLIRSGSRLTVIGPVPWLGGGSARYPAAQAVSTEKAVMLRSASPNSTPTSRTGTPKSRYLSA